MFLTPRIESELVGYLTEFDGSCGLRGIDYEALHMAPARCRTSAGVEVSTVPRGFGSALAAGPPRRALGALGPEERGAIVAYYAWGRATPAARRAAGPLGRMAAVIVLTPAYQARAGDAPVFEGIARVQRDAGGLDLCRVQANALLRRACKSYCQALRSEW